MKHPYQVLKDEYTRLLASMRVTRPLEIQIAAHKLLRPENLSRYRLVSERTGVPAAWIAAIDMRETGANSALALGQGDPWNRVSTRVPRGKGPFTSWVDAAVYYVNYDHVNDNSAAWCLPYASWKAEVYNGFGPRNRGVFTGYLWAGTNHYKKGKYVADGVWSNDTVDRQLGVIPLIYRMVALEPSLDFDPNIDERAKFNMHAVPPSPPLSAPVGTHTEKHDTAWLQNALNHAYLPPDAQLVVDGSYGRRTREAVRSFQRSNGLEPDGLYGPKTDAALTAAFEQGKGVSS